MKSRIFSAVVVLCVAGCAYTARSGEGGVEVIARTQQASLGGPLPTSVELHVSGNSQPTQDLQFTEDNGTWTVSVSGLPDGTYTFDAVARSEGMEIYRGSNQGVITTGTTSQLTVVLNQTGGDTYHDTAPIFTSLLAFSNKVHAGDDVALSVVASDDDPGDSLTFAWTTDDCGTSNDTPVETATTSSTTWHAPTDPPDGTGGFPVVCRLVVTVTDSHEAKAWGFFDIEVDADEEVGP